MEHDLKTEVLIVGAGPTGLMAANQLQRFGIDFVIADKKAGPTKESRAIAVTARSLEIYQQMGLSQAAVAGGKIINGFNLYSGGRRRAQVKIGEIGKGISEFSYMLAFEQSSNEELLSKNLVEQGIRIYWEHEFVELTEYQDGIVAQLKSGQAMLSVKARYLIACDGASSPVRQQLGFSFHGGTYKHKFFVADTELTWDLQYDQLIISPGKLNFCAFLPLRGARGYRIVGTLPKAYFHQEDISFRDIEEVILNTLGVEVKFDSVNWFSIYKLHHRCVDRFAKGPVFLAGDSAHIHSPAGGQGMNTGLQDAYNLCWKLAMVLKNQAHPKLLDTYNQERLPFARWLLQFTDRGFNFMTSRRWLIRLFRKYLALPAAGLALSNQRIRPIAFRIISQTWYSYKGMSLSKSISSQKLRFKAGDRLPYFSQDNIYPQFTQASFHLLHLNHRPLDEKMTETVRHIFPFELKVVENPLSDHWKKLGVKSEIFLLVRPDNHIAFIFDSLSADEIERYLRRWFNTNQDKHMLN